ncbi:MAG TPA: GNAT family N-acetyltransferase [Blastocatellia bacterium]|nr:GNAT family N-acetyltransferase [Blastocatellia bacterium]
MKPQVTCKTIPGSALNHEGFPSANVRELDERDYQQALALLAHHPIQGVHLESLITDHGLTSPALRGRFYGYFEQEQLTGIALMGHQIMFCAPDQALPLLARAAADSGLRHTVIFGPKQQVELFWEHYAALGCELKLLRDFYWYVCETPAQPIHQFQLVQATTEHLEAVQEAQASTLYEATGTDPRVTDPEGFRRRVRERIERGRTWIKLENDTIVFKAELQSVTPDVIYLEGIWTHPGYRKQGIARECVVELTHRRLRQQQMLCLVVEPEENVALRIYEHAGFRYASDYQARYPQPPNTTPAVEA